MARGKGTRQSISQQRAIWGAGWDNFYSAHWTKEEIVSRIRSVESSGKQIHMAAVAGRGEWHLIRAASYYFGSWRAAVKAAGYNYEKIRADKIWSRGKVVQGIRRLRREGKSLNSRTVQLTEPALFAAGCRKRLFGSWEAAVQASGYSYDRIRLYQPWDEERVAVKVEALKQAGVSLNAKSVVVKYPLLYWAACRRYGSWGKTLDALGYDSQEHMLRRKRSRAEIVEGIRRLQRKGVHLSDSSVRAVSPALHAAACRAFNGWANAREVALRKGRRQPHQLQIGF